MIEGQQRTDGKNLAPIVFVHGDFGDGEGTWGDLVARIGPHRPTVVLDRPGAGARFDPDERFTFVGDAAAVATAMESLGAGPVHLVGHSYGGLVAIAAAASRPDLVRSLHLIEPPFFALVPNDAAALAMSDEAREIQARFSQEGADASTAAFFTMIGLERAVERLRGTSDWEQLTRHAPRFARSEPAGDFPVAVIDRLPSDLPIVVYTGGRSHPALRRIAQSLAARLPQARIVEIADATHAVQRTGDAFLEPLLAAISERPAAGDTGGAVNEAAKLDDHD